MKKVTEWLCGWLETSLWGFNSSLSRIKGELGRMRALQMCGKEEGIRVVILHL